MGYTHKLNCTHRDLKLENILLDRHLNIKLSDFGFAREYEQRTLLDTICGTPAYMAPELILRHKYSGPAIDIWSLGIILFTLLVGTMPFDEDDEEIMKLQITTKEPNYPTSLPTDAKNLVVKLLNKDPEKRSSLTIKDILEDEFLEPYGSDELNYLNLKQPSPFSTKLERHLIRKLKNVHIDTDLLMKSVVNNSCDSLSANWELLLRREKKKELRKNALSGTSRRNSMQRSRSRTRRNSHTPRVERLITLEVTHTTTTNSSTPIITRPSSIKEDPEENETIKQKKSAGHELFKAKSAHDLFRLVHSNKDDLEKTSENSIQNNNKNELRINNEGRKSSHHSEHTNSTTGIHSNDSSTSKTNQSSDDVIISLGDTMSKSKKNKFLKLTNFKSWVHRMQKKPPTRPLLNEDHLSSFQVQNNNNNSSNNGNNNINNNIINNVISTSNNNGQQQQVTPTSVNGAFNILNDSTTTPPNNRTTPLDQDPANNISPQNLWLKKMPRPISQISQFSEISNASLFSQLSSNSINSQQQQQQKQPGRSKTSSSFSSSHQRSLSRLSTNSSTSGQSSTKSSTYSYRTSSPDYMQWGNMSSRATMRTSTPIRNGGDTAFPSTTTGTISVVQQSAFLRKRKTALGGSPTASYHSRRLNNSLNSKNNNASRNSNLRNLRRKGATSNASTKGSVIEEEEDDDYEEVPSNTNTSSSANGIGGSISPIKTTIDMNLPEIEENDNSNGDEHENNEHEIENDLENNNSMSLLGSSRGESTNSFSQYDHDNENDEIINNHDKPLLSSSHTSSLIAIERGRPF